MADKLLLCYNIKYAPMNERSESTGSAAPAATSPDVRSLHLYLKRRVVGRHYEEFSRALGRDLVAANLARLGLVSARTNSPKNRHKPEVTIIGKAELQGPAISVVRAEARVRYDVPWLRNVRDGYFYDLTHNPVEVKDAKGGVKRIDHYFDLAPTPKTAEVLLKERADSLHSLAKLSISLIVPDPEPPVASKLTVAYGGNDMTPATIEETMDIIQERIGEYPVHAIMRPAWKPLPRAA